MSRVSRAVPRSWWEDEPRRLERERAAMQLAAPGLVWDDDQASGGWQGVVPAWPFDRSSPRGLAGLLARGQLDVRIIYGHAYPMVEPAVWPRSVDVPWQTLGWTAWHVLPNGSLCLLQAHSDWDPASLAADLVPKIAGWHIECRLMQLGLITAMTERGIAGDDSLDALIEHYEPSAGSERP